MPPLLIPLDLHCPGSGGDSVLGLACEGPCSSDLWGCQLQVLAREAAGDPFEGLPFKAMADRMGEAFMPVAEVCPSDTTSM